MVSSKYSESGATQVQKDLNENHGRHLSRQYIQTISQSIGSLIAEKTNWKYNIEVSNEHVKTVSISIDGTCMLLCDDGYRQAMVGSISLYYFGGERLYTRYTALPPEYGKEQFHKAFEREIKMVRKLYPNATFVGVADGASDNWTFLQSYVDEQILDFYHASEYLSRASKAAFKQSDQASQWLEKACHTLKEEKDGAELVLGQMKTLWNNKKIKKEKEGIIQSSITYFSNHLHQMDYCKYQQNNWPIGSGVIEAACKVIIKQRLCNSGMKWTDKGARTVLALRCFNKSDGMWEQFWNKINRYGK
jgi:quinol monooxygenase YgiN